MKGEDDSRSGDKDTTIGAGADNTITKVENTISIGEINTTYDNSHHDNSSHHYGDTHNITNFYGEGDWKLVLQRKYERALKRLEERISRGAAHDSAERGPHAPKCHEGTREAVQGEMISWVDRGEQDTNPADILWLCGPAGCGKTAIAGSVADECHARGWLAGGFFVSSFAGTPDRCSKEYIIPTLAYQLLHLCIPGLREEILSSIDANPSVFDKRMDQQLDILILNPLRKVGQVVAPSTWPKAIVIDGVDECNADNGRKFDTEQERQQSRDHNHREILSTLVRASNDGCFPFRIVVTSRPERAIQRHFNSLPEGTIKHVFLDTKYDPKADIELYLRAMLGKIGLDYQLPDDWYQQAVPPDWPEYRTRDVPCYIAEEASEQFVYAATVIRFVQDGTNTPAEQLKCALSSTDSTRLGSGSNPFSALDALYTLIIQSSPTPLLSATWLLAIKHVHEGSWFIKALLESSPGETELRLGNLTSLVGLFSDDGEPDFTFHHKSLLEFLEDPERSGKLYIDWDSVLYPFLQDRYYQVLKNREPQVPLPSHRLEEFLNSFCRRCASFHRSCYQYDASDVDWWRPRVDGFDDDGFQPRYAFEKVHADCHWYHCRSSCKVWRRGILRTCKEKGWRVPTRMTLLKDRFKKLDYYPANSNNAPLSAPRLA